MSKDYDRIIKLFNDAGYELIEERTGHWMNLWDPDNENYFSFVYRDGKPKRYKTNREIMDFIKRRMYDTGFIAGEESAKRKLREALGL